MPRTAPAPNIPAIPGMNPGVIIKAGGGAGGGSGAGGGKGRGGKKGAGTGHGQENAAGGQKSASDCGTGSTGGCTNCTSGASAGDPIDVSDGTVFTRPSVDLLLSGRIDIEFKRKYLSSQRDEEWGLGRGWSHSFAWRLTEKHRSVLVEGPMGSVVEFFFDVHHKVSMGTGGWVLSQVQGGYVLDCKDGFEHHFRGVGPDREPFVLTHISAINGNAITIERDERNRVARVVDPADRVIHFDWGSHGRVSQVWMQDPNTGKRIVFAAYGYDSAGHLVRHEDADGNATEYEYDASHRLTRYTLPTALSFCFKYDASHRCIESWGAYPFADIALDEELPQTFENGDPILGIYHVKLEFDDDYTEVLDTQRLRRYHFKDGKISGADSGLGFTSRIFDEAGNMMSHTDANGATSHYEYDVRGRLTSETDPLGHRFEFRRDRHGNVIENVDPSGRTIKRVLDQDDNPVELIDQAGAVTRYRYAADGQMTHRIEPDGSTVEFRSDAHGNLVEVVYPSGERWSYEWDYFGRLIRLTSPVGKVTEFTYTDAGRLVYLQDSLGKEVRASYNGLGDLVSVTNAQGTTQFRWGGYRWLAEVVYPNGDVEQARYNRMGWLTRRVNELGQSERYHRSVLGLVTRIESFDGSVTEYEYDAMRRVLADREGPSIGESFDRDALGRVTKTTYADGTVEQYTYDEHGHLLSATSPWVTSRWVYNDVGLCIEEEHVIDGESTVVRNEYDVMRRKVRTSSSLQHSQRFIWRNGLRSQVVLDDRLVVGETRDVLRRLVGQELPGGARVNSVFDEYSRLERRWVGAPRRQTGDAEQQPHRTLEQWFNYDADDQLTVSSMAEGETIYYEYDSRRRLLSKRSSTGEREEFSHDSASNLFEAGPTAVGRVYDRGNRLLRRGATSFDYDAGGRLRFKANMLDDGTTERWEYRWSAQGLLDSVHRPDGRVVRFTYDALERRTLKRVFHGDGEGGALISSTRYVWDGVQILHEVERTRSQDYDWVVKIRSYFYEDGRLGPQGHCDVVEQGGTRSVGEWVFYVGDVLETPTTLIDGEGAVKGELLRSVYGKTSTRPGSTVTSTARFEGQFEDVETGLFYNYHRYYDPETGRYISPDPIGTNGLLNLYQYCTNPVGYVDPFGLHELNVQLVQLNEDGTEKRIHQPGAVDGHRNGQGGGFSSGGKHKGNPKRIPDTGKPGTDTSLFGLGKAHTERQALEWAKKVHGDKLKGSRMDMRGQFPPCTACSNAMRQFARNEECEITYEYPTDRKIRYSPKESDASPQAVTQQSELKALCESYQSRTHTPEAKKEAGAAERARLGYQTSETSTNVAADGRTGSSGDNYTKEKDQATQGGVKEPKPFPRPEPEASQTAGSKRSADSALGGSAAKKPRRGIE